MSCCWHSVGISALSYRALRPATAHCNQVNPAQGYFGGGTVTVPATTAMEAVRLKGAGALNALLNETAVMPSTTVSLNNVALGLVSSGFVKQGDRVLTTDQVGLSGALLAHLGRAARHSDASDTIQLLCPP